MGTDISLTLKDSGAIGTEAVGIKSFYLSPCFTSVRVSGMWLWLGICSGNARVKTSLTKDVQDSSVQQRGEEEKQHTHNCR